MNMLTTASATTLLLLATACGSAGSGPEGSGRAEPTRSANPASASASSSAATTPAGDLADLPLLHGWPTQDELGSDGTIAGPSDDMEPVDLTACGRTVRLDPRERVGARLVGIEDERTRAVGRHRDEAEADAAAAELVALFAQCPEEPHDALTEVHRVTGEPRARGGAVITTSFRYDSSAAMGSEGLVVLQRGATVVVSTMSREGLGQGDARALARQQVRQLQPVITALE